MDNDIILRNYHFHTKKRIRLVSKNMFFTFIIFAMVLSFPSHTFAASVPSNILPLQISDTGQDTSVTGPDDGPSSAGTKPDACFSWNPTPPIPILVGALVSFDASCSVDPDGGSIPQDGVPVTHDNPIDGKGGVSSCSCAGFDRTIRFDDMNQIGLYSGPDESGDRFTEEDVSDAAIFDEIQLFSSYSWDFGDGTSSTERNPAHIYTTANDYQVSLTVVDNEGKSGTTTHMVYVALSPFLLAVIDEIHPSPGVKGEPVSFSGHGEDPLGGSIIGYNWNSSINGKFSTEQSFTTAGLAAGTHIIFFKVQNSSGKWSSEVQTTLLINIPPIANTRKDPYFGWVHKPILFDGSGSIDPDGTIVAYKWNFGDGTVITGKITNHIYSHIGTYTVILTVTDNDGASNIAVTIALVVCDSPIADAGGPYHGYVNHPVFFNGSNSSDNDGNISNYVWDFGDGTIGTGQTPLHIYQKNGTYVVKLTVTDADGKTDADTTSVNITYNLLPTNPELQGVASGYIDHEYAYIAVSTDPEHDNISYLFDWGDTTNTTTPFFPDGTIINETHTWMSSGSYTIRVYATDENNATSEPTEFFVLMLNDTSSNSFNGQIFENEISGQTSTITRSANEPGTKAGSYVIMGFIFLPIVIVAAMIFLCTKKRF